MCQGVGGVVGAPCGLAQGGGIFKINYDVDFLVGVNDERVVAFQIELDTAHRWLTVSLRGPPGNPTAVGARVTVPR